MATKIVTKNSSTASAVPTASDLVQGELAVNVADKRLFTEDNTGTIVELGTNPSTIDINAGSIDGTAIGASSASTGAFTTLTATGLTVDGDSGGGGGSTTPVVAVISDTDGGSSWVSGTIFAATDYKSGDGSGAGSGVRVRTGIAQEASSGSTSSYIVQTAPTTAGTMVDRLKISSGGSISFYEDTGTTAKLFWDASAESLGIGTTLPSGLAHIYSSSSGATAGGGGDELILESSTTTGLSILSGTSNDGNILFGDSGNSAIGYVQYKHANDALAFGSNGSERMRIDSSGNVLVGTTNTAPASSGNVAGSSLLAIGKAEHSRDGGVVLALNRKTSDGTIAEFRKDGSAVGSIGTEGGDLAIGNGDAGIQFVNGNEHFRPFNVTTNVATDNLMDIGSSSKRFKDLYLSGAANVGGGASISPDADADNLVIQENGAAGITIGSSASSVGSIRFADSGSPRAGMIYYNHVGNEMRFYTNASERMRIDSSGNLLVGVTTNSSSVAGVTAGNSGLITACRSSNYSGIFNRLSTDGDIVQFRKDGSVVGSIGNTTTHLFIGSGDVGLRFDGANNRIRPVGNASDLGSARDNAIDLGDSSARFDDIYATNGTIQTSDRNEKQDIAELSEAEQRVAVAAKGLLRKFRWKDSVAEKGDDARIHFGIIAQDLQAAFEAEGLDAGDYAMFISTTWTDEETNEEKTRMGVRYSELLAFIISAI